MHVQAVNVQSHIIHNAMQVAHLVDGDSEFRVDVAHGNFRVATGHDVRIDAHTNRNGISKFIGKFFQSFKVVDVDLNTDGYRFLNLVDTYTVWGEKDLIWSKSCAQAQLNFSQTNGI